MHGGPIRLHSPQPQHAKRVQQARGIALPRETVGERRNDPLIAREFRVLPCERAQHVAGPDLEQDMAGILEQLRDARGELHRLAGMAAPVGGIGCFLLRHPFASHAGHVGNLRRMQSRLGRARGEGLDHGVHHRGMERMRRHEPPAHDFFATKLLL